MSSSATKLIPDSNAQYLYTLELYWSDRGQSDCIPGSLVENVRLEGAFFKFNFVGGTIQCHSYYGWAFVLNTPENLVRYAACQDLQNKIHVLEQELRSAQRKVIKLEGNDLGENTDAAPVLVCA